MKKLSAEKFHGVPHAGSVGVEPETRPPLADAK
jgi:hypothetical protein